MAGIGDVICDYDVPEYSNAENNSTRVSARSGQDHCCGAHNFKPAKLNNDANLLKCSVYIAAEMIYRG